MFEKEVSLVTGSRREDGRLLKDKADKFIVTHSRNVA